MHLPQDGDFSELRFREVVNAALANNIGNMLQVIKQRGGKLKMVVVGGSNSADLSALVVGFWNSSVSHAFAQSHSTSLKVTLALTCAFPSQRTLSLLARDCGGKLVVDTDKGLPEDLPLRTLARCEWCNWCDACRGCQLSPTLAHVRGLTPSK